MVDQKKGLNAVDRLNYLRRQLEGEAYGCIAGLELTEKNYSVAITLLQKRYGDSQIIINAHYKELMDLPEPPNQTSKLRQTFDTIERYLRSLQVLGVNINHKHLVLMIQSKLPKPVKLQLQLHKKPEKVWTVELLRKELQYHIANREMVEQQYNQNDLSSRNKMSFLKSPRKSTAEALFTNEARLSTGTINKKCHFCRGRHRTYPTIEKRIRGSCYRCLRPGHRSRDCSDDKLCVHCGKWNPHHRSLCPEKFSIDKQEQKWEEKSKKEVTSSATEEQPETIEADSLLASEEKVLIQTAKTTVKNTTKDVSAEVRMF